MIQTGLTLIQDLRKAGADIDVIEEDADITVRIIVAIQATSEFDMRVRTKMRLRCLL